VGNVGERGKRKDSRRKEGKEKGSVREGERGARKGGWRMCVRTGRDGGRSGELKGWGEDGRNRLEQGSDLLLRGGRKEEKLLSNRCGRWPRKRAGKSPIKKKTHKRFVER